MPTKKPKSKTIADIKSEVARPTDSKAAAELAAERQAAREKLQDVTIDTLLANLTHLGLEVSRQLAQLGERLRSSFEVLAATNVAIQEAEERLQTVHDLDAAQTAIDQLVAEYTAQEKERSERAATETKAYEQRVAERDTRWATEDAQRRIDRKRDEDAYNYATQTSRARDNDQYEQAKLQRDRAEADARAKRTAELDARGDGTTCSSILAAAIVRQAFAYCRRNPQASPQRVVRRLAAIYAKALESAAGARALDEVRSLGREMAQASGGKSGK